MDAEATINKMIRPIDTAMDFGLRVDLDFKSSHFAIVKILRSISSRLFAELIYFWETYSAKTSFLISSAFSALKKTSTSLIANSIAVPGP